MIKKETAQFCRFFYFYLSAKHLEILYISTCLFLYKFSAISQENKNKNCNFLAQF
jgi:hypothetical protein